MRTYFIICFLFFGSMSMIDAQFSSVILPCFNTAERDSLKNIENGYSILNTSTGCINYFFNTKWLEVCGECSPSPKAAYIDSIVVDAGISSIYFSPSVNGCSYTIINDQNNELIVGSGSPIVTTRLKLNSTYQFKIKTISSCGESESQKWSDSFLIKQMDYCKGEATYNDPTTNKTYTLTSIGQACWMNEYLSVDASLIKGSKEVKLDNSNTFFTWKFASNTINGDIIQGVCPAGYHLPTKVEVQSLISLYRINPSVDFFKSPIGAYDFGKKKVESKEFYFLWTSELNSFILSTGGEPSLMQSDANVGMPVRCVKD